MNHSSIDQFFSTVNRFDKVVSAGEKNHTIALLKQKELISSLNKKLEQLIHTKKTLSPLSAEIEKVIMGIKETIQKVDDATLEMDQRLQLQRAYSERLIILVFGKVNAGKSSLSNYLVSLFHKRFPNESIRYFYFENGKKIDSKQPFKVGSTETTATIQGVEFGKIVFLDTPGLHSVTEANGVLTKNYTDSADLILWLSGSNSPGQTQELEALKTELNKGKVLFPVITKSDKTEEDVVLVDGVEQIVQKLEMKSVDVQNLQQEDVYKRAKEKLVHFNQDIHLSGLYSPVSLSTHYAKEYSQEANILDTAGISSLFNGLNQIYAAAIESKKSNVITQVNHHLDTIQKILLTHITAPFNTLLASLKEQKAFIRNQSHYISDMVLEAVKISVPKIIAHHEQDKDISAINTEINLFIKSEVETQLQLIFDTAFKSLLIDSAPPESLDIDLDSDFENDTISYEHQTGATKKSLITGVGTVIASTIGAALLSNPAGWTVLAAGMAGGFFGKATGDFFIHTERVTIVTGVNSDKIEAEINHKLEQIIPMTIEQSIDSLLSQFTPLERTIEQSIYEIKTFKEQR